MPHSREVVDLIAELKAQRPVGEFEVTGHHTADEYIWVAVRHTDGSPACTVPTSIVPADGLQGLIQQYGRQELTRGAGCLPECTRCSKEMIWRPLDVDDTKVALVAAA
ncbi:hypothetical protein [Corallococcus carmarthensis]|uniref:Uncharacterized protein n=1 Tax=Corallococcus carmarthensis TaxID=2316728 RepID=A0A3A8KA62_9BACT|nr:hypothetical protein [Corallococcus carmarthensis]RKH05053.1 hypothetical protein D7X32_09040 [Corallococcus carmarthensis]